jgi:hypothetical protein
MALSENPTENPPGFSGLAFERRATLRHQS